MLLPLANADAPDTSGSSLQLIVICLLTFALCAAAAFVPVVIAWKNKNRHADKILAAAVVWGILTAGSVAFVTNQQMSWAREKYVRITSGFYDPREETDAPTTPFATWTLLGAAYLVLVAIPLFQANLKPARRR